MAATRICVVKLHVTQDGLFQEFLWYHVFKHLFLEITREQTYRAIVKTHMDDVVIIYIVHPHAITIVGRLHHAIFRWIHSNIPMITLATKSDHRVHLQNFRDRENLWLLMYKGQ